MYMCLFLYFFNFNLSALTKSGVFLSWILPESLLSRVGGVVDRIDIKAHQSASTLGVAKILCVSREGALLSINTMYPSHGPGQGEGGGCLVGHRLSLQ